MNIYFVNQYAITPDTSGGSRHFELSKAMHSHGVTAEIVAADLNLGTREYMRRSSGQRKAVLETYDSVPFHWIYAGNYRTNDWRRAASMLEFSWNAYHYIRHLPRPDAIIGSSPHLFAALAAQRAAAKLHVPFLFEIRDIWPQTLVDMTGRVSTSAKILEHIASFLYRKADGLITLARGTNRHLEELGYPASKIIYLPNGVDVEAFPELTNVERRRVRERYGLPSDDRLFVYAGTHGRANGLDIALDTAALLLQEPGVGIVLVGDGTEKNDLKQRAKQGGLANVYFLDPVPKLEIPALLGAMDAGLLLLRNVPVFRYGISPNKLFDYWAARLPAIATTPGEIGDLITESHGGKVTPPEEPEALAQAIKFYLANPEALRREGLAGRAFVQERFSRTLLASRLAEFLLSTAG